VGGVSQFAPLRQELEHRFLREVFTEFGHDCDELILRPQEFSFLEKTYNISDSFFWGGGVKIKEINKMKDKHTFHELKNFPYNGDEVIFLI